MMITIFAVIGRLTNNNFIYTAKVFRIINCEQIKFTVGQATNNSRAT